MEKKITNIVTAIAGGGQAPEFLVEALKSLEANKTALLVALDAAQAHPLLSMDRAKVMRELKASVADVQKLLGGRVVQARQMLKKLLGGGKVTFSPVNNERGRGFSYSGMLVPG